MYKMSSRAGKSRFYIGLVSLILMIGFVAIFHSSQQQLDESRQLRIRCEQQQEALNARLQAIIEHKFRIEKSLETERREHLESKQHFEQKSKEQKEINNKATMELTHRYESLQQHYKLLQSEHNDYIEECSKTKESNLEQINGLERKVKSLQSQLQQYKHQHEKDIEQWKLKYQSLENEKQRLEDMVKSSPSSNDYTVQKYKRINENLEKIITEYKTHCDYQPHNIDDILELNMNNKNKNVSPSSDAGRAGGVSESKGALEANQIAPNLLMNADELNKQNHNNNNGDSKQVLQQPPPLHSPIKSSTPSNPLKTPDRSSKGIRETEKENHFASVANPTSEKMKRSSTLASDRKKEYAGRSKSKPIPLGVAPVPENFEALIKNDENNRSERDNNENDNQNINMNNNNNNRYANVVDEQDQEQDNGAHEVKDDFNIEGKDHLREVLDNVNNAGEEDTNNFLDSKGFGGGDEVIGGGHDNKKDDEDVVVIGNNNVEKQEKSDNLLKGDNKLIHEVIGDQGKEAPFADGMHLEEHNEEEDDEDDYSNPAARQQEGPAVRN